MVGLSSFETKLMLFLCKRKVAEYLGKKKGKDLGLGLG